MSDSNKKYQELIARINGNIYQNTTRAITGEKLNTQLRDIVEVINTTKIGATDTITGLDTDDKTLVGAINELSVRSGKGVLVYDELPTTGIPNTIYIIPTTGTATEQNSTDEYIWINDRWEKLGSDSTDSNTPMSEEDILNALQPRRSEVMIPVTRKKLYKE